MIFFDLDNLLIYDEMIEYLFDYLFYVRIKGVDYLVLKFCCVKDIGYFFILVLKILNELIYGDLGDVFGFIFELILCEMFLFILFFVCYLENSGSSLVLKVNFVFVLEDLVILFLIYLLIRER